MAPLRLIPPLLLVACGGGSRQTEPSLDLLDMGAVLAEGQVRAGFVADEAHFWGGPAAEARAGDIKLYNDRVRFAIQVPNRDGSYYLQQAGLVIDADIVRPEGQPGQDMVDEWLAMAGIGRLIDADTVTIENDGRDGKAAVVVARGGGSALAFMEGVLESHGELVDDLGLVFEHRYTLEPDSWLLRVDVTVTATDTEASLLFGDGVLPAGETMQEWVPRFGYEGAGPNNLLWKGQVGKRNEVALALFPADEVPRGSAGLQALSSLLEVSAAFDADEVLLAPGQSHTWTRYWGVGPDLATLSDAWREREGLSSQPVSGIVEGPDGPVAGARVVVYTQDEPFTMALSREDGTWSAKVPPGSATRTVVDGRGPGLFFDLPEGAAHYGHLAARPAQERALQSLDTGALPIALAQGMGVGDGTQPLAAPGRLHLSNPAGAPFEVRVRRLESEPEVDGRAVVERPHGWEAAGWSTGGDLELMVEQGYFDVIVHRGPRYERMVFDTTLSAGETVRFDVDLPETLHPEGWLFSDPHVHAGPSADGKVSMVHRLISQAATGNQLHIATEHDQIADYSALLAPLGLEEVIGAVPAVEVSPVIRGHLNLYPLTQRGDRVNGGAWPWWSFAVEDTTDEFARLRDYLGGPLTENSGFVLQLNHPAAGMLGFAGWRPGEIRNPELYASDFDAIEVLVGGRDIETLEMYIDLVNRGHEVTPTGVTDSHDLFENNPGLAGTWFHMGTNDPAEWTPNALRRAMIGHHTIVSRGLFLEMSILPGSELQGPATLDVAVPSNSWVSADRLLLLRDGDEVERIEGDTATFTLDPEVDASYIVIAESDQPLAPLWSGTPWAMSAAIKVDIDGDGWTPPLPPLVLDP